MKKFGKILLAFIFTGILPAAILIQLNEGIAGLAWTFALVIGQGFGQILAPFYQDKEQEEIENIPKQESSGILNGLSVILGVLIVLAVLYAVLWLTYPAYMNCVNNFPDTQYVKSFFDAVQSCKP